MMEPVLIGDATLYLGDCLDILPTLGPVDAVVTDPPYGVGLEYETHIDTKEWVQKIAPWIVEESLRHAPVVSITPGNGSQHLYPKPTWTLCWFNRAGAGRCSWGFSCWQPILVYGKDPFLSHGEGARGDYIEHNEISEKNGHPCPKPIRFMAKWIDRVAHRATTILDPFMGSGTTGVACARLGRRFIGIEIEPKYFEIACKRIEREYAQLKLFPTEPKRETVQMELEDV